MAHQSLERKLSYYNDPEYAAVRHAQSGRLFNWVKVSHGFKKFRLRRWNSTGSWSPEPSGIIDLTNFHVAEGNYTKRKNVFKLTTVSYQQQNFQQYPLQHQPPTSAQSHQHLALHHTQSSSGGLGGATSSVAASFFSGGLYRGYERELLLQADSQHDMRLWMDSLRTVCRSSQHLASAVSIIHRAEYHSE
ncbi:conserved hypothetical protein [Culex quinquefasciatus]|uniref:Uncharacterized protein n=1 Tax=Culex quinquefasciatus TaxID=7176 RepID=B0XKG7_CULQU|nr:conserved hypothetical protein [Culex quinquefasciatus]|eukprot:XP_001870139.1 conserved hypothetical protein [Culex quinquefasciatus]